MNPSRDTLHLLAEQHRLSPQAHRALLALGQPVLGADWPARTARALGLVAALCAGLALVMAVASQWGGWGRPLRFAVLQGALLLALVLAWRQPRARPAWALLAFIGQGALFAYFGQTYQTGADPWQLFALWALLGLPVMVTARHDAPWALWSLVASVAVVLAVQTYSGRRWLLLPGDPWPVLGGAAGLLALAALLAPWAARWQGAGRWAWRAQCAWTASALCAWALTALFSDGTWVESLLLAGLLALSIGLLWRDGDGVVLALAVAALDGWLLGVWGKLLFDGGGGQLGSVFVFALGAAGILAASVSLLLRRARALEPTA